MPIVPQARDEVKRFVEETGLPFDVLIDERRDATRQYGVWHRIGLDAWNTARPAVFLVGRDGRFGFTWIGDNQREFPDARTLLDHLFDD